MGFFDGWEDEKKKRKIDGGKTATAGSFFTDVGKNIVAGAQQGAGVLADVAIQGGALLDEAALAGKSEDEKNKQRQKNLENTEMLRGLVHDSTDITGKNVEGTQKANEAAQRLQDGEGDFRDVAQVVGTSLDAGLAATSLINPLSAGRAAAVEAGTKLTGKELATDIAKTAATFGGTSAAAETANTYAETGDAGEALKQGAVAGVTGAIIPTALDVAGRGAGRGIREVLNKKATDNQSTALADMTGARAAAEATDRTGKPVTQSQIVNSAEPEVRSEPTLNMDELAQVAERPAGVSPSEYLKQKNAQPTTMAAEVTPGRDLVVDMPTQNGRVGTESGGVPSADAPVTGIVAKPKIAQDTPAPSALGDTPIALPTREVDPSLQPMVSEQLRDIDGKSSPGFADRYTKGFINRSTEEAGKLGADISSSMVKGSKLKSDITNELRPTMQSIEKDVKKLGGKTPIGQRAVMSRMADALENREGAEKMLSPDEFKTYQKIAQIYDYIKDERIARGLNVREDYSPRQMIKDMGDPDRIAKMSLTTKLTTADSRFSKERTSDDGENAILSVKDLYNYVNSQSTEFAYKEAQDIFEDGMKNISPELANSKQFQNGIRNLADAYSKAVNPRASSKADKIIKAFQGTVYKNILWNNPKNAAFSATQTILARGDVTSEAKSVAKTFDKDMLKTIDDQKWFGDATQSADAPDNARVSELAKNTSKFTKYDLNRAGEEYAVKRPFRLGYAQGLVETQAYKDAIKGGASKAEAAKAAMQDEVANAYATRTGNVLVNNTAFGANSMARPEFLRDATAVKRTFTMFMRFPLGMTELVAKSMKPAEARAIDVLMKGDPRAVPVPEMRDKYKKTLQALGDIQKAAKDGKLGDIKMEAIDASINNMKANIKDVDETIKSLSSIRGNKRAAALVKMWAATAAIQFAWTGMTDPENASPIDALAAADPTIASKVNPTNPYSIERAGLTSPLIPANRYGINWNGATNLVPGAGIVNRGVKLATGKSAVDWLRGKE